MGRITTVTVHRYCGYIMEVQIYWEFLFLVSAGHMLPYVVLIQVSTDKLVKISTY